MSCSLRGWAGAVQGSVLGTGDPKLSSLARMSHSPCKSCCRPGSAKQHPHLQQLTGQVTGMCGHGGELMTRMRELGEQSMCWDPRNRMDHCCPSTSSPGPSASWRNNLSPWSITSWRNNLSPWSITSWRNDLGFLEEHCGLPSLCQRALRLTQDAVLSSSPL